MLKFTSICGRAFLAVMLISIFASCDSSNTEMEKKLAGSWETTRDEDVQGMKLKTTEKVTYTYSETGDNPFSTELIINITSPEAFDFGKVTYTGTWEVQGEDIIESIDKDSFHFELTDLLEAADKNDFEKSFLEELKKGEYAQSGNIISLTAKEFKLQNPETKNTAIYSRIK